MVFIIWLLKKFSRRDSGRFRLFRRLSKFEDFEEVLRGLDELIQSPYKKQSSGIRLDAMAGETMRIDEAATSHSDSLTPRHSGTTEYNPVMRPIPCSDALNSFVNNPVSPNEHSELEARTQHGDSSSTTRGQQQQQRQEERLSVRTGQVPDLYSPSSYSMPTPFRRDLLSPSSAASMTRTASRAHDDISELGEGDIRV